MDVFDGDDTFGPLILSRTWTGTRNPLQCNTVYYRLHHSAEEDSLELTMAEVWPSAVPNRLGGEAAESTPSITLHVGLVLPDQLGIELTRPFGSPLTSTLPVHLALSRLTSSYALSHLPPHRQRDRLCAFSTYLLRILPLLLFAACFLSLVGLNHIHSPMTTGYQAWVSRSACPTKLRRLLRWTRSSSSSSVDFSSASRRGILLALSRDGTLTSQCKRCNAANEPR